MKQKKRERRGGERPYYEIVRDQIARNIRSKKLGRDVVLFEGQLASLLGVSREPVKRALDLLAKDGLIRRFGGRGYLVGAADGKGEPQRLDVRTLDLDISVDIKAAGPRASWQKIHGEVAQEVVSCIPFGTYQISESAMVRHFGVSRTVVRDVLSRLDQDGLVEKDMWSHWTAGPLTAREINDRFELRRILEPVGLKAVAGLLDRGVLLEMKRRLERITRSNAKITQAEVDQVERDVHETIVLQIPNRRLAAAIRQSQLPDVINRLFGIHVGVHDVREIAAEHALVLDRLLLADPDAAAEALSAHLKLEQARTLARLKVLSVIPDPVAAPYLIRFGGPSTSGRPAPRRYLSSPRVSKGKPLLRVMGRSEILIEPVQRQAKEDLDFDIRFELVDGLPASQRATTKPESFDVYHQGHTVDLIWTARSIQPINVKRIPGWDEVAALAELRDGERSIFGDVFQHLYVQSDGRLGGTPTDNASMLPVAHGTDALGYMPVVRTQLAKREPDSWAWLLDDRWRGKVALLSDASLGMIEAALATEASGRATFKDISNLSTDEIDAIVAILVEKKNAGHFRAFWETYDDAIRLMERGDVLIQSIFSPAITELRRRGVPVQSAVPVEGYRGWHSDLCISTHAHGGTLEAAYAYLNWWMEGPGGAILARQGYYSSAGRNIKRHLSPAEWDFWYAGQPAAAELPGPDGGTNIPVGASRDGGSYFHRMSKVRVWNTFMDEHNYLTRRWNEFLLSGTR